MEGHLGSSIRGAQVQFQNPAAIFSLGSVFRVLMMCTSVNSQGKLRVGFISKVWSNNKKDGWHNSSVNSSTVSIIYYQRSSRSKRHARVSICFTSPTQRTGKWPPKKMTTYRAKMLINAVESVSTMIPSKASRQESTFSVFHAAERNEKKQKTPLFINVFKNWVIQNQRTKSSKSSIRQSNVATSADSQMMFTKTSIYGDVPMSMAIPGTQIGGTYHI